jgi:hypothetical protein
MHRRPKGPLAPLLDDTTPYRDIIRKSVTRGLAGPIDIVLVVIRYPPLALPNGTSPSYEPH